jgi:hypothetical protein
MLYSFFRINVGTFLFASTTLDGHVKKLGFSQSHQIYLLKKMATACQDNNMLARPMKQMVEDCLNKDDNIYLSHVCIMAT